MADVLISSRKASAGAIPAAVHSDAEIREWVRELVLPEREVWVAATGGGPVLAVLVLEHEWVDQLYVAPARTGEGLGSRLIDLAKSRRPAGLQLWVFLTNTRALRFYRRHGFTVAETTDGSANEARAPDLRLVWPGPTTSMGAPAGGSFLATSQAYDRFMGRYSRPLAEAFVDAVGVAPGQAVLDVGCGPGALTGVLVDRLGAGLVSTCDPSPPFVAECAARHPGGSVLAGQAEDIPFDTAGFDRVLAQLVLHFVTDPGRGAREFHRVLRPGGVAAACVWDFADGMQMLRLFWDAALALDPAAPDEARTLRFGREGEIGEWLVEAGFRDLRETVLEVSSSYASFDELWDGFLAGIGPSGSYCVGLDDEHRAALREELFRRAGSPTGSFALAAKARCASGRLPGRLG